MRILYALNSFRPHIDGVSISIERQAIGLARRGHEIAIAAPSPSFSSRVDDSAPYRLYSFRSIPLDQSSRRVPLFSRRRVIHALHEFQPDAVVVSVPFLLSRTVCQVARERGFPLIGITSMMPEWFYYNVALLGPLARFLNRGLWQIITNYYNQCDHVIGVTATALDFLTRHGLRQPSTVISNGVPLGTFHPRPRDERLAWRLGVPDKPTVLYVGRLDAEKCMDVWVRAIPRILARVDAHFIIGGDGSERQALERLVEGLGASSHVSFVGFRSDEEYPSIFSLADVFAISSPVELQSIVTLEAAASGLPIVAARAGALPELIQDGKNGRLFRPSDPADLADTVVEVLASPERRQAMGLAAQQTARQHDFDLILDRYERLYKRVIYHQVPIPSTAEPAIG